uniref:HIG1 domain-containing protein n=1 Tax=Phaeomonas parva TaxID=124430 RepID=A0A6U4FFK3_9STRA|mmetsp:Transcript_25336/g.79459  ORF Transcript_25336/g.79459 Transcript_25336/m.79459 type:complete len:115 (+) Transcript_25336:40-384(+)
MEGKAEGTPVPETPSGEIRRKRVRQGFLEKLWAEPLVPIGAAVTTLCLFGAMNAFRKKDPYRMNTMMKGRVGAQAFTVLAMCGGVGMLPALGFDWVPKPDRSDARFKRSEDESR